MKKIAYTYITAFIVSVLVVIFLINNLKALIYTLFIIILSTMIVCDIISKKTNKDLLIDIILIFVLICFMYFTRNNIYTNPYSLITAIVCMLTSLSRTIKLIEE